MHCSYWLSYFRGENRPITRLNKTRRWCLVSGGRYNSNGGRNEGEDAHRLPSSIVNMSSLVRIRLSFQRSLSLAEIKNCWFLVDTSKCSTIADLEYLIKKRFGELSKAGSSVSLNLYLEDYLLPSQEKIEVIQQNDNIRYLS